MAAHLDACDAAPRCRRSLAAPPLDRNCTLETRPLESKLDISNTGDVLYVVDANILFYAVDELSPHHSASADWLVRALTQPGRIALSDGMLAALAIENGLSVTSADSDFARFTEVRWVNPLRS